MIVVMKKGASQEEIEHMIRRVEQLGLRAHPIFGTERTVIAAIGEKRDELRQSLESGPGVAQVVPILAPYKVASREVKAEPTVVRDCVASIISQCSSYHHSEAIIQRLHQMNLHDPATIEHLAEHVFAFSLGGIRSLAALRQSSQQRSTRS